MSAVPLDGRCPACGYMHLVADADSGAITCSWQECPSPTLVADLLAKPDQHVHLIEFREDGYTCQHPLAERVQPESLFACALATEFAALTAPPGIGMFRVPVGGALADAEPVDRDEVLFETPAAPPSPEGRASGPHLRDLLPIGSLHVIPRGTDVPEGFREVTDREVRLLRATHRELGDVVEAAGFDSVDIDGDEYVAIDLPPDALSTLPAHSLLILRIY